MEEHLLKFVYYWFQFSTYLKHPLFSLFAELLCKPEQALLLRKFWDEEIPKLLSTVKNKDLATLELLSNMVESVGPNDQVSFWYLCIIALTLVCTLT